jgi:SAM-dependent methyltransferase
MAYFDNVNTSILDLVPASVQRICELGCGAGALAAAIRRKCDLLDYYVGLEIDDVQAALSREHTSVTIERNLDLIPQWDLDTELSNAVPKNSFDVVIMGDVLEHLYSPLLTLQQAASRLRPDGIAIACIPNVQHWTVFLNLIRGTWPQNDMGLFDRTHIRWFTLDDMVRLFRDAGLEVQGIVPRVFESEEALSVLEDLEFLARNQGVDPDVLIARGQALQFVLIGKRLH